jgi:hypothetical protein
MPEHLSISVADADHDAKQGRRKPARRCRAKRRGPPGVILVNAVAVECSLRQDVATDRRALRSRCGRRVGVTPLTRRAGRVHECTSGPARRRIFPDPAINRYVFQLLGIEGKVVERAAEQVVEQAIIDSISEHMSHSSGGDSAGADGGHGGDGGGH